MASRKLFGLLFVLLVGIASRADATVLCANAGGAVFVRQACGPRESQLDPVALGLVGPQGPAGPAGVSLFANVALDGTLTNGTATSASRSSTGLYVVMFAQDVSQCTAVVTPGSSGAGVSRLNAWANTAISIGPSVEIRFNSPGEPVTPVDTDFHVIVVC